MTTFSADNVDNYQPDDASYRTWVKWMHDAIVGCGWVQTADTGQFNFTTTTRPATGPGYSAPLIYRMDDALQATFPVFMRIEPGAAGNQATAAYRVTFGSGSTGTGNVTGNTSSLFQAQATTQSVGGASPNKLHRVSGANNRLSMLLFGQAGVTSGSTYAMFMNIERTKNADGSDNGDGLLVFTSMNNMNNVAGWRHLVVQPPGIAQTPVAYMNTPLGVFDGTNFQSTIRSGGATAAAFHVIASNLRATLPLLNLLAYYHGDFAEFVPLTVQHFGAPRIFLPVGRYNIDRMGRSSTPTSNDAVAGLMRWE